MNTFKQANGRRLKSIETHDIMCKIAAVVVAGSSRRSALLSLSDLNDEEMRHAKNANWWENNQQRALANNSVSYKERPDMETFLREWKTLIESKAGERGIINLSGMRSHAEKIGKRNVNIIDGVNPCLTEDTLILTNDGEQSIASLIGIPFKVLVHGNEYDCLSGFFKTNEDTVYIINTKNNQQIKATSKHQFMILLKGGPHWIEVEHIKVGDFIQMKDDMWDEIESITHDNHTYPVYDCIVEDVHEFVANNFRTHNCGEISLTNREFCNLLL